MIDNEQKGSTINIKNCLSGNFNSEVQMELKWNINQIVIKQISKISENENIIGKCYYHKID